MVNTHLYGAHLASGGAVLPEHDVVVFDEAHELEEVMTSSLGVEVTPGRFRALVDRGAVAGRGARRRDCSTRWRSVGDQLGALVGDRVGTRVLHDEAAAARGRPRAGRAARPRPPSSAGGSPTRCGAAGAQRSLPRRATAAPTDPDRASRKTRAVQAAAHLAEDLHRLVSRTDGEVAWVDGTRRNVRLRLSPIDVGPGARRRCSGAR